MLVITHLLAGANQIADGFTGGSDMDKSSLARGAGKLIAIAHICCIAGWRVVLPGRRECKHMVPVQHGEETRWSASPR